MSSTIFSRPSKRERTIRPGQSLRGAEALASAMNRESPGFSRGECQFFAPQAPGSQPISGHFIFCNPNPLDHPNPFLPLIPAVLLPARDIMSPKISRPLFSPSPEDRSPSTFPKPVFRRILRFFPPNLNLHLASLFAIFPNFFLVLLWLVDSIFVDRSTVQSDVTDKRKPFERMGRKTSDLSNGSWVTQVTSGLFLAHSFEAKNGLFVYGPSYRGGQL